MKSSRSYLATLAIGVLVTTNANAVPVSIDFTGTVTQHSVIDYPPGEQVEIWSDVGTTWSAQFLIETDLFGPMQTFDGSFSRQGSFAGLPGAVTPSLTIGGVAIDVGRFNTDTSTVRFADSNGLISFPGGGWVIQPDQWIVKFASREITSAGTTSLSDLTMSFVDYFDAETLLGGTSLLSFDEVTSPLSAVLLPFENPLWYRDVDYTVENYSCDTTCKVSNLDFWSLGVTSVTRTVHPVPEPSSLALLLAGLGVLVLRRRRAPAAA
jgi:hypothetical protein